MFLFGFFFDGRKLLFQPCLYGFIVLFDGSFGGSLNRKPPAVQVFADRADRQILPEIIFAVVFWSCSLSGRRILEKICLYLLTFVSRSFLYKLQFIAVSVLSYTFTNFCISSALEPITFSRSIDTWAVFRNSKTGSFSP